MTRLWVIKDTRTRRDRHGKPRERAVLGISRGTLHLAGNVVSGPLGQERLSLTRAFARAGRRTVFVVPANTVDWPQGAKYYGFDKLYDARNAGYRGPKFGYASMPDQYTLEHFRRTELAQPHRRRVFAEMPHTIE